MRQVVIDWVRYDSKDVTVQAHVEAVDKAGSRIGYVLSSMTHVFPESDLIIAGKSNGRKDKEWGNAEIEKVILAAPITGAKVLRGHAGQPAIVDFMTGDVIREAVEPRPSVIVQEGLHYEGITAIIWA